MPIKKADEAKMKEFHDRLAKVEAKIPHLATKKQLRDIEAKTSFQLEAIKLDLAATNETLAKQDKTLAILAKESKEQLQHQRQQREQGDRMEALLRRDVDLEKILNPPTVGNTAELVVEDEDPIPEPDPTPKYGDDA